MSRPKVLLFVHGVRNDDRATAWLGGLNSALRREGTETVEARGYEVRGPSYLRLLDVDPVPACDEPRMTYVKGSDDDYARAAAKYWSALARLERYGLRDSECHPDFRANIPADTPAARALMKSLFPQAEAFRRRADRRHAIYTELLKSVPDDADLVVIAHSLGSVVVADLIYYLPPGCKLRMLITLGSPLALKDLREHLGRRRNRFPFERVGAWINLVGVDDYVTGCRGLSQYFPEALDLFVDTGSPPGGTHSAPAYLDQAALAQAFDWLDQEHESRQTSGETSTLPDLPLPDAALSVVVGSQYALRVEQAQESGEKRVRYGEARRLVIERVARQLADAGFEHPILHRLAYDNASYLAGRVEPADALPLLLTAHMMNPIAPCEIKLSSEIRGKALAILGGDLGVPSTWAKKIVSAGEAARDPHDSLRNLIRAAAAVAGVAAVVALPFLVLAAAPAGLAGGAAIVGGLTALGPGGMLGGIGIVGLLGGAGGAVTAQALTSGSAAEVEQTVVYLQALAIAKSDLEQTDGRRPEWYALIAMEDAASDDYARMSLFSDDGAPGVEELERKLKSIRKALEWMREQSLDPPSLGASDDEAD